jgi:hypothetical protein
MDQPQTAPVSTGSHIVRVPPLRELFRDVWAFYKDNMTFLALVTLVGVVISVGPLLVVLVLYAVVAFVLSVSDAGGELFGLVSVVFGMLGVLAVLWIFIGGSVAQIMGVDAAFRGKSATLNGLLKEAFDTTLLMRFIGGTFLYGVLIIAGFLLFIIPGVMLLIPAMYFPYLLIKEKQPVWPTIQRSWKITRGFWWVTFIRVSWVSLALGLVMALLSLLTGATIFVLGPAGVLLYGLTVTAFSILVSGPIMLVMTRKMYETISGFKAADAEAKHKLTGGEILQIIALIILWGFLNSVGKFPMNQNQTGSSGFDEDEFERMLEDAESNY